MCSARDSPQRSRRTRRKECMRVFLSVLGALCVLCGEPAAGVRAARSQEPAAPQPVSAAQLQAAINKLGDLDYATRTEASRTVRRSPSAQAVPALIQAVAEHADGYVRYRALVLLTGFNDPRTKDSMRESLSSPNDRLRTVAYSFFERNPDPAMVPPLLTALDKELAEFVRPALVRALAANGTDPRVRQALQRTAPRPSQPAIAAAICLLGVNCASHHGYLVEVLKFSNQTAGFQELLRGAAAGLAALGVAGHAEAVASLFEIGIPSADPTRAPVALALGTIALRATPLMMTTLEQHPNREKAIALLAEGFDMLQEDLDKERFFALARRTYWDSPERSPRRALMQTLIGQLDF